MKTIEQRAIAACRDYVLFNAEIKRIGKEIGHALTACGVDNGNAVDTHLSIYYANRKAEFADSFFFDGRVDGQDEFEACPHCVLADQLVQQRKTARIALRTVKASITRLGKEAA